MWTEPVVTVAPANEPVTLAEVKEHCRVDGTDDDATLAIYIAAAREHVESYTGLKLVGQTVTFSRRHFRTETGLPVAPVQSITIAYQDGDNATQTLASSVYVLSGANTLRPVLSRAEGQTWPTLYDTPEAFTVTAVVGYAAIPDAIRHAILLLVGQWFDNRASVSETAMQEIPFTVSALLENYRTFA